MKQAIERTIQQPTWSKARIIRKALRTLIPAILLSITTTSDSDEVLLSEAGSPPFIHTFQSASLENGSELIIRGNNKSNGQQILIIRIDNADSSNYRTRVNKEFTLAPGPFERVLPLSGLTTSGGKPFKQPYVKLIVFAADMWSGIQLEKILISSANQLPEKTLALDFGSNRSAAFPGFVSIGKGNPYFKGKVTERVRSSGDSLIRDGIAGATSLQIPWPNGQWKLSLWAQDQGEWEYLPHFLTRKYTANGTSLIDKKLTREQWITNVYLAGNKQEGGIDGDLWTLVGERRSGLVTREIQVTDGMVNIHLKGDYDARYLSALVLEPLDGNFAKATQAKRRERFLNKWPVASPPYSPPESLSLQDISQQIKDDGAFYPAPRDSILNLAFEIQSPFDDIAPVVIVSPLKSTEGKLLKVTTRYGHWRYERPTPNATSLILSDSYLRADMESIELSSQRPRRLYVQVAIPSEALPGDYSGKIQLFSRGELRLLDYKVRVLPVILPKLEKAVGLYLEPTPYYQWFKSLKSEASIATACDLSFLAAHGFSTVAPALATPGNEAARQQFMQQLKQIKHFGFNGKVLAYSPLKRLLQQKSELSAGADLMQLRKSLQGQNLPEIYWSIFDEPAKNRFTKIKRTDNLLNDDALQFKTAGHMNNEHQAEIAEVTDLLLINHGTEVSEDTINDLQEHSTVWLYNMPAPRLAAGLYLWRSGAEGYLQWHGRMPTADPFDPTDGREGDVIYIYPSASQCPEVLDIHRRFIDLHEATIDLRWLQWLESESEKSSQAREILANIRSNIPSQWSDLSEVTNKDLLDIRKKIYSQIQD